MGLVSHWYYNTSKGETVEDSRERLVLVGGYGGYTAEHRLYDGFYCRADSWYTNDGFTWHLLKLENSFGGRAWFGLVVRADEDPRVDTYLNTSLGFPAEPPKMYLYGGGYTGFRTNTGQIVSDMVGKADAYWSRDGINWVTINYQEGGGTTDIPFFSSQVLFIFYMMNIMITL